MDNLDHESSKFSRTRNAQIIIISQSICEAELCCPWGSIQDLMEFKHAQCHEKRMIPCKMAAPKETTINELFVWSFFLIL